MQQILKLMPKALAARYYGCLLLEQGLVAFSTYALIRASSLAVTDVAAAFDWVLVFLFCLTATYLPGILGRYWMEDMIQKTYQKFLNGTFPSEGRGISQWAQRSVKEAYLTSVSSEGQNQVRQVVTTLLDLSALILNVGLNLAVLGHEFDPVIFVAFALGSGLAYLFFRSFTSKIDQVAGDSQAARNLLFSKVQRSWDNMFAAHGIHRKHYFQSLRDDQDRARGAALNAAIWSEGISIATTYVIMLPVVGAAVYLITKNFSSAFLVSMLATLPRQFQVMGNLQVLISYLTLMTGITAQVKSVVEASAVPSVDTRKFVRPDMIQLQTSDFSRLSTAAAIADVIAGRLQQGRVVVRGSNGAGKSSLLVSVKEAMGDGAYYLPAHLDFWMPQESRTLSSGERILQTLEFAEGAGLPQVLLLDEWDANLDPENKARMNAKIEQLAQNRLVIEVRHHA